MNHLNRTIRFILSAALMLALAFSFAVLSAGEASAKEEATAPYTLKGQVTAKGEKQFTLKVGNQSLIIAVNPQTSFAYQSGGSSAPTFADLKVGMSIETQVGRASGTPGVVAIRVLLPAVQEIKPVTIAGKVVAKGQDNFTLNFGKYTYTFGVTTATKFFQNYKATNFAAMKVGMDVQLVIKFNPATIRYEVLTVYLPSSK